MTHMAANMPQAFPTQEQEHKMLRQSDQLEMLHNKLSQRYGPDDVLCRQVSAALAFCRKLEPVEAKKHDWSVSFKRTVATYRHETQQKSRY